MPFTAYILYSYSGNIFYKGSTSNIEERLRWHNEGLVNFTSKHRPWILVHQEHFNTRAEAIKKEKYFKTGVGRDWIRDNIIIP
jgi:putative endonuclease